MSGFSTSRFGGIDNIVKQYGTVLRGYGPPVPKAGVLGDLYIDNLTFQVFEKRRAGSLDDWGHFLFVMPAPFRATLKWFGPSAPGNTIGITGDYFLQWSGYDNYGMQPTIWGPKIPSGWPENGQGPTTVITSSDIDQLGVADEGLDLKDMVPTKLRAIGLFDEYIVPFTVTANQNDTVITTGVQSSGQLIVITINTLYTAEDTHGI